MKKPLRKNKVGRKNLTLNNPTESIQKGNYVAELIKNKYYNYYNIKHRYAVCKIDAIAYKLTYGFAKRCVAKTFKFYSSHEISGEEIMQKHRAIWEQLNCNEIVQKCVPSFERDGFTLINMDKEKLQNELEKLKYYVYGEFECAPENWVRDSKNKILLYKVRYIPMPRGRGSGIPQLQISGVGNETLRAIERDHLPKEIIHVERGNPNDGYGDPLIEGAWDSIIKLAGSSHYDMLSKRLVPELHVTEDEHDDDHAKSKGMLKMVANSDQDTARVWYHKKNARGEILDYPKFGMVSGNATIEGSLAGRHDGISTGDYGNVDKEWMRLCSITEHTIHYFGGNRAGAVVGSETDTDDDIETEIIEFREVAKIIRKICEKLVDMGLMPPLEEKFVIKYWKDWENIESQREKERKEEERFKQKQLPMQGQPDQQKQLPDSRNQAVIMELLYCIRNNMSYPMTSVGSSWIARIGYDDKTEKLLMELLSGKVYSKPAPLGEWSYLDWADAASKGGYFWDYLSQRDPPWQLDTIPADLGKYEGFGTPEEMSEFKTTLIGESSEPYGFEDLEKLKKKQQAYDLVKIPILDYPLINSLDTETKIKRLGQKNGWSMGTGTSSKIKRMLESLKDNANKHQLRINTLTAEAFGNSIKENHPLLYDIGNGVVVEEYICPDSWKKNVGKTVPLGVYHNLEQDLPELPDWQVVGTAEIFGWDDEDGYDYVKYNYDHDKIDAVFRKLGEYNWLRYIFNNGLKPDQSTAYYCDIEIKWNDKMQKFIRVQTNIELISISFVPAGNCPGEICSLTEVKRNINEMQAYIKKCINEGIDKDQCIAKAYARFKAK